MSGRHTQCSHCGDYASQLCVGCHIHAYCDKSCQKVNWKLHKPVCSWEKRLQEMVAQARDMQTPKGVKQILRKETDDLWSSAPDWACMVKANRCYMLGELFYSTVQLGPIFEETKRDLSDFMFLHDYGIITTDSQPHEDVEFKDNNTWYASRGRPYVHFLIPTKHPKMPEGKVLQFVKCLLGFCDSMLVIAMGYEYPNSPLRRSGEAFPKFTSNVYKVMKRTDLYMVTEGKRTSTREGLKDVNWAGHTHLGVQPTGLESMLKDVENYGREPFPASVAADPIAISVAAQSWDTKWSELFVTLKVALEHAGLQPIFKMRN
ncbi:hypothetical protein BDV96DRAFT_583201 [Lophiotrema nucula]|uniref:MYND-type domain-containing protein n=1 Tax=Lophiotrema nucula TaxID=690887 RepID=A0A6A5YXZ7_9PLEO|nr:hypothetical protein BDV96DRAFT_583201 [Lophiotrema nucula]